MKVKVQIQYQNKNVDALEIEKRVKEDLKSQGVKMTTIDTMDIYFKPEDNSIYYVVKTKTGDVVGNKQPIYIA